jgi:hypothetical protein
VQLKNLDQKLLPQNNAAAQLTSLFVAIPLILIPLAKSLNGNGFRGLNYLFPKFMSQVEGGLAQLKLPILL